MNWGQPLAIVAQSTTRPAAHTTALERAIHPALAMRETLVPFAASRVLLLIVTAVVMALNGLRSVPGATVPVSETLAGYWDRWDALWYLRVATDGYSAAPDLHNHVSLAFFPLYPLALHLLLAVWPWSPGAGALVLSNLCFFAAACTLYQLVVLDFGHRWARRSVWMLALFPTSLFFFGGYSESLFLLCLLRCCYHLRLRQWWMAGLWGGLAGAARPLGILLVGPFLVAWWERGGPTLSLHPRALARGALARFRRAPEALAAGALIPAGVLAYMIFLWLRFGQPFAFSASQRSWHRGWAWPWQALIGAFTQPFAHFPNLGGSDVHALTDTLWGVIFLAISVPATRALPVRYSCYLWLFWLEVLSTPALLDGVPSPLISLPRFLATAFPLIIFLSGTRKRFLISCALSVPLLIFNTIVFLSGGWVA
ncbi:MAG TPA: mannosyltransferase family protein [Chloroflexota bacterium]|jgi:hypothetical protein